MALVSNRTLPGHDAIYARTKTETGMDRVAVESRSVIMRQAAVDSAAALPEDESPAASLPQDEKSKRHSWVPWAGSVLDTKYILPGI